MAYADIAEIHGDYDLRQRMIACAATEHVAGSYEQWVADQAWALASQPGWESAWASAKAAGKTDLGADEGVITDAMILSAVQTLKAEAT